MSTHHTREFERTEETMQKTNDDNRKKHDVKHIKFKNQDEYGAFSHPLWSQDDFNNVKFTHQIPNIFVDRLAYFTSWVIRWFNNIISGWLFGRMWGWFVFDEYLWLIRLCLYESFASMGNMFALSRHISSILFLRRDYGWTEPLLLESYNKQMHLLLLLQLLKPSLLFRCLFVLKLCIGAIFSFFSYFINRRYCHRLAAYMEESGVILYSELLEDIDKKKLPLFDQDAMEIAKSYYQLPSGTKWRDVFANMRCDEAFHRDNNHLLAPLSVKPQSKNPIHNDRYPSY